MEIPTLLSDAAPRPVVAAYPMETVVAEKLHAMVQHGLINTRMKDYFDLWRIAGSLPFEGQVLSDAIASTFRRQQRPLPDHPQGLSDAMVARSGSQWQAFVKKQKLDAPMDFGAVVTRVGEFLLPVIAAARLDGPPPADWQPGSGWSPSSSPAP